MTSFRVAFKVPQEKLGVVMAYLTDQCGEIDLNIIKDVPYHKNKPRTEAPRAEKPSVEKKKTGRPGLSEDAFKKAIEIDGGSTTSKRVREVMEKMGLRTAGYYSALQRLRKKGFVTLTSDKKITLKDAA